LGAVRHLKSGSPFGFIKTPSIDNNSSRFFTIIDVFAEDQPSLLYDITRSMKPLVVFSGILPVKYSQRNFYRLGCINKPIELPWGYRVFHNLQDDIGKRVALRQMPFKDNLFVISESYKRMEPFDGAENNSRTRADIFVFSSIWDDIQICSITGYASQSHQQGVIA
jgi:hypothetical protein